MKDDIDKKWTDRKLIEETIRSMSLHSEPAPETRERLVKLETNHNNIMEKIEEILKRFDNFETKLDCALEKKANVWVEKVIVWLGIFIGAGVLTYFGSLIVKVIEL